uniref:Uncharacterized protein n=1 Tax=Arundo donax TaxID=35708 RepID=A0A0A9D123_ARUDO
MLHSSSMKVTVCPCNHRVDFHVLHVSLSSQGSCSRLAVNESCE